jgi:hypothetical protein
MGVNNWIGGMEIIDTGSISTGTQSCKPGEGDGGQLDPQIGCITQAPNVVAGETGPTRISFWNAGTRRPAR